MSHASSGTPRLDLPPSIATGVGSLPLTDPGEAARVVAGELPDLPHLAELPGRGPGADMIGRTAALLVDIAVDLQPSGWRLVSRPGRDMQRAHDYLSWDLDALEESLGEWAGPVKVQFCGPWTLAAAIEKTTGHKALTDSGLVADLGDSLREGVRAHLAQVRRRLPYARLILQLDEPSVTAVLQGSVPTPSGWGHVAPVEEAVVREGLAGMIAAAGVPVAVHCCADAPPVGLFRAAGAAAVSVDLAMLTVATDDALGEAVDAGLSLWLGAVPATPGEPQDTSLLPAQRQQSARAPLPAPSAPLGKAVEPVRRLWNRLGFPAGTARAHTVVTPTCGLAGAEMSYARAVMTRTRDLARAFGEDPEGRSPGADSGQRGGDSSD